MSTYNVVFAGVGGQGVITASGILAGSAVRSGLDVRMYGSYGMSQRGGSVSAQVRIGDRVLNARIEKGEVHLLVAMELIEAVRWAPSLAPSGRLLSSLSLIPPSGKVLRDGGARHIEFLRARPGSVLLDTEYLCGTAGSRGVTAVLLGAASSLEGFPVRAAVLEEELAGEAGSRSAPVLDAFRRGSEAAK